MHHFGHDGAQRLLQLITNAVSVFLLIALFYTLQYIFDMEFVCSCKPGTSKNAVLYVLLPPLILTLFVNFTEPFHQKRTLPSCSWHLCSRCCRSFNNCCSHVLKLVTRYVGLGAVWASAVLFDGDWYFCLQTNLNISQTGLPCKRDLTYNEMRIKDAYKTESLNIGFGVICVLLFLWSLFEIRGAYCRLKCPTTCSKICSKNCIDTCKTWGSNCKKSCSNGCDRVVSCFCGALLKSEEPTAEGSAPQSASQSAPQSAPQCSNSINSITLLAAAVCAGCCDCCECSPYYSVVYEELLAEQVSEHLNSQLREIAKLRAEAICKKHLDRIKENMLKLSNTTQCCDGDWNISDSWEKISAFDFYRTTDLTSIKRTQTPDFSTQFIDSSTTKQTQTTDPSSSGDQNNGTPGPGDQDPSLGEASVSGGDSVGDDIHITIDDDNCPLLRDKM